MPDSVKQTVVWRTRLPVLTQGVLAEVEFLPWQRVDSLDNNTLSDQWTRGIRRSGVYVAAVFGDTPAPEEVDPLCSEVAYIGMTKGQQTSLRARTAAFATAARGGTAPHAGAYTWREKGIGDVFWLSIAPTPDCASSSWQPQCIAMWPELAEKALLFAYGDRHGRYPSANKEGWHLPAISDELVRHVSSVLEVEEERVPDVATQAILSILSTLGYQPQPVHPDSGRLHRDFFGAEVKFGVHYWLWLGRHTNGLGRIEIGRSNTEAAWLERDFADSGQARNALVRLLSSYWTNAGMP